MLALGGAAAVLGSVLFILWKAYFGRGRERRWDRGEAWWGAETARLPEWDEWDVSAGRGSGPPRVRLRGVTPREGRSAWVGDSAPQPADPRERARSGSRAVVSPTTERWVGISEGVRHRPARPRDPGLLVGAGAPRARPRSSVEPAPGPARARPAPAQCAQPAAQGMSGEAAAPFPGADASLSPLVSPATLGCRNC